MFIEFKYRINVQGDEGIQAPSAILAFSSHTSLRSHCQVHAAVLWMSVQSGALECDDTLFVL